MGTCNFIGCGRFGLWAVLGDYDEEYYAQEYPELTEAQRYEIYAEDTGEWYSECAKEMERALDDLNDTLIFHRLGVRGGYYDGVEIVLEDIRYAYGGSNPSATEYDDDEELQWYVEEALGTGWHHDENCTKAKHLRKCREMYEAECERIMRFLVDGMGEYHMFYPFSHMAGMGWDMSVPYDRNDVEELEMSLTRISKAPTYPLTQFVEAVE